ncbi:hypothetical protein ACVCIH_06415 [Burkholderia glumae]|uniref:hypothetical protein n=1 Tax=Burkholderia glumae TaxID=337 RepID=UPI00157B1C63|nr:hypothetical protein [Burkholderia glumae]
MTRLTHAAYEVSDAETGWSLEGIRGDSVDAAHAAALEAFARLDDKQWKRMIQRAISTA